jgi:hypothetical protein
MSSTTFVNLTGYLLSNSEGLIRSFTVVNSGYQVLSGADVTIKRFINNTWTIMGEKTTDDSGIASFLMNPSFFYRVEATYHGMSSGVKEIQPTQSVYTIIIPFGGGITEYNGMFSGVSYNILPGGLWLGSTNNTLITFNVTCSDNDLEWFGFTLLGILPDGNNTTIYTGNTTGSGGGSLMASIDTTNLTYVYGNFSFKKSGYTTFAVPKNWIIDDLSLQNISLVGTLFNFKNIDSGEMSLGVKSLIVLIVVDTELLFCFAHFYFQYIIY